MKQSLKEYLIANGFPQIYVCEMFDTRFVKLRWEDGNESVGYGELSDGTEIKITIEADIYLVDKDRAWLNLAFERKIDGKWSQELLRVNQNTSDVFGAVRNALIDKIAKISQNYQIDALVGMVAKGQEKRLDLYSKFFTSKLYGIPGWHKWNTTVNLNGGGQAYVALSNDLPRDEHKIVLDRLKELSK